MSAAPATVLDRYSRADGTVYLTGIQAIVRLILDRARVDRALGRATGGYVSGYEGSPLAGLDLELARRTQLLDAAGVVHRPGLNEELAATAVSGSQQARTAGLRAEHRGVTGYWYGKAPGLDRATDALRHANLTGTDPAGGAVALVGDDPAAKSSSVPCSSEPALADLGMPTLVPADAGEILEFGLHAVELSRATGLWSALRIATVVADGAASSALPHDWRAPSLADLPGGLRAYTHKPTAHLLLGTTLMDLERSFFENRLPVAGEYVRRSGINRITGPADARIGIVAAGPTYLALRQALELLGLDEHRLARAGIRALKLGAVFPLEPSIVREFASGLTSLVVVEGKRGFLEDAVRAVLYGSSAAPEVLGKRDRGGATLFEPTGELDADHIGVALRRVLADLGVPGLAEPAAAAAQRAVGGADGRSRTALPLAKRAPFFCSGCPHNSSTEVDPGTLVGAGIGCHALIMLMPGERAGTITGLTQMGGEGAQWLGMAPFVERTHFVQNIGDGTFAHSGSLAVRAAVAAGANMTFKLLRNSTVAMTGGQDPVGETSLSELVAQLHAERVARVVVTTDQPRRVRRQLGRGVSGRGASGRGASGRGALGHGVEVKHRDDLRDVQRELAETPGVTVLVHDQECAAEKRRKRRRGKIETPTARAFVNERVCEGCGDCGAKSNCLSVQPVETEYGRKTRINQSSCNLDLSCLDGDCPSFLSVTPGKAARPAVNPDGPPLPEPVPAVPADRFGVRLAGVGGTGVVTVSQLVATAASLDGRFVRVLDQTGLAQKGGAVVSDVTVTHDPSLSSPKLAEGQCDLYLGCDAVVAADPVHLKAASSARTVAVVSSARLPTAEMIVDPRAEYPDPDGLLSAIAARSREIGALDAAGIASARLGSEQYANMLLLGVAYQCGALPLSLAAIERAIELNGTAVPANLAAFRIGRELAVGDDAVPAAQRPTAEPDAAALIADRAADLVAYQDRDYAQVYRSFAEDVHARDLAAGGDGRLTVAVARNLYKLMAYKDEYEVARLSLDSALRAAVEAEFGAGARFRYRLHPPVLRAMGMKRKVELGPWFRPVFATLRSMRRLRGTAFDPFGYAKIRRIERALIDEYRAGVGALLDAVTPRTYEQAVAIAALPDLVRGYESIKLGNVARYRDRLAAALGDLRETAERPAVEAGVPAAG